MPRYVDYQMNKDQYGVNEKLFDINAIILAIRNILLSRPGNFPFDPSIGIDIKKYQFEFLDKETIFSIQTELNKAISKLIPDTTDVTIKVVKVDHDNNPYLGIAIGAAINEEEIEANFLFGQEGDIVKVFNEIY